MAYLTDLLWQHPQPVIFANLMVQGRAGLAEGLMNLRCSVQAALSEEAKDKGGSWSVQAVNSLLPRKWSW